MTILYSSHVESQTLSENEYVLTDFESIGAELDWYVVNDNVMGGRSKGEFVIDSGRFEFEGVTNTNGGGFSSVRTETPNLDLANYHGIRLYVLGDGRDYTWRLYAGTRWRAGPISYSSVFPTQLNEMVSISIPFSDFSPVFRGFKLNGPKLDVKSVSAMGIMINDQQDGPFSLQIDRVVAYKNLPTFRLSDFAWKKRVLVLSAPNAENKHLKQMTDSIKHSSADFEDRQLVLLVLQNQGRSNVGDRVLTAEEDAELREKLGVQTDVFEMQLLGKDTKVKLRSNTSVEINEIYELIDSMPMRKRELGH